MRRKDREVTDIFEIKEMVELCKTCHVTMIDKDTPYVLPLSFGYEIADGALTLYFHSAKEGRKLDILRKNNKVCFEMCDEGEPVFATVTPCNSGYFYSCVHGFGEVEFIEQPQEKSRALSLIMQRQAGLKIDFTAEQASAVCVYKIVSRDFTAKRKKRPQGAAE